ncbi:MAG: hypothetical protein ACI8P3_004313 [Saprospiraceae bacterium]|jgi:hypothetical protein
MVGMANQKRQLKFIKMKISASWIYDNIILVLFLGVQAFVLASALGWFGYSFYKENFSTKMKPDSVSIFAESSLEGNLQSEINMYKRLNSSDPEFQLHSISRDESVQKFIKNETEMIFITRPLSEQEISQIDPLRLPIAQQDLLIGTESTFQKVYLIHDNDYPLVNQALENALLKKKDNLLAKQKLPG